MIRIECIPFKNFKDRMQKTRELLKKVRPTTVEVYSNFIYVEIEDRKRGIN